MQQEIIKRVETETFINTFISWKSKRFKTQTCKIHTDVHSTNNKYMYTSYKNEYRGHWITKVEWKKKGWQYYKIKKIKLTKYWYNYNSIRNQDIDWFNKSGISANKSMKRYREWMNLKCLSVHNIKSIVFWIVWLSRNRKST